MNPNNSETYRNDLLYAIKSNDFCFFKDASILITGCTGLICSAIVDLIITSNKVNNSSIKLFLAGRSEKTIVSRFGKNAAIEFLQYDALKNIHFTCSPDYIIHGAGMASPELYVSNPVETMNTNYIGLLNLLNFAKANNVRKVLYISSSEVYGNKQQGGSNSEDNYGTIDPLQGRSSYPMSKKASETLCKSYSNEYGVSTVIVRPGHIYGPTAHETDKRISSDFAFKSAYGAPLVLKSAGLQKRSYMYCLDSALAIMRVLEKGIIGEAYNICSKEVISIKEMAQELAIAGNVKLEYNEPSNDELAAFNPMDDSSLDWHKLYSLGFGHLFTSQEGLFHTVQIIKECL